jgi:hypothetical protein
MDFALQGIKREELEKAQAAAKKRSKTLHRTEIEGKEGAEWAWKVRLYPDINERKKLNRWMGIYRWTYNQCVAFYKQPSKKNTVKKQTKHKHEISFEMCCKLISLILLIVIY